MSVRAVATHIGTPAHKVTSFYLGRSAYVGNSKIACKMYRYMGSVQMGYGARTFSTYMNNGGSTFLENVYTGQILFSFISIFNIRYYLC